MFPDCLYLLGFVKLFEYSCNESGLAGPIYGQICFGLAEGRVSGALWSEAIVRQATLGGCGKPGL